MDSFHRIGWISNAIASKVYCRKRNALQIAYFKQPLIVTSAPDVPAWFCPWSCYAYLSLLASNPNSASIAYLSSSNILCSITSPYYTWWIKYTRKIVPWIQGCAEFWSLSSSTSWFGSPVDTTNSCQRLTTFGDLILFNLNWQPI